MIRRNTCHVAALATLVAALLVAAPAGAEGAADFFKGKRLTYIVAASPGGGYDAYARLIGKYMAKRLGVSRIVVKNMPGAGHIIGTNHVYAARPDGLTIGTFNTGLIYAQIIGRKGIRFDLSKMSWIGKAAADPRVFMVSKKSGIANFTDLRKIKKPITVATSGVGSAAHNETIMLAAALGLKLKIIPGYRGNQAEMAMMRGEIVGQLGSKRSFAPFVKNGYGRFIFQVGGSGAVLRRSSWRPPKMAERSPGWWHRSRPWAV